MAHCINIQHPEYKKLVQETSLGQRELKARIATWQEIHNNYESFPSAKQVENLREDIKALKTPYDAFGRLRYVRNNFGYVSDKHLIVGVDNLLRHFDINSFHELYENFFAVAELDMSGTPIRKVSNLTAKEALSNLLPVILTTRELSDLQQSEGFSENDLESMYSRFLLGYTKNIHENYLRFFNRINAISEVISTDLKGFESYLIKHIQDTNKNQLSKFLDASNDYIEESNSTNSIFESGRDAIGKSVEGAINLNESLKKFKSKFPNQIITYDILDKEAEKYTIWIHAPKFSDFEETFELGNVSINRMEAARETFDKYFEGKSKIGLRDLLTKLKKDGYNVAGVIEAMLENDLEVEALTDEITMLSWIGEISNSDSGSTAAYYRGSEHKIRLSLMGLNPETIIHEATHAVLHNYVIKNPNSERVTKLKRIFEKAREIDGIKGTYAATDFEEFISELFSKKETKEALLNHPAFQLDASEEIDNRNVFQQFWDAILEFFGITRENNPEYANLFNQSYNAALEIIDEGRSYYYNSTKQDFHNLYFGGEDRVNHMLQSDMAEVIDFEGSPEEGSSGEAASETLGDALSNSLKRLSAFYNPVELNEVKDYISTIFIQALDDYSKMHPSYSRVELINFLGTSTILLETRDRMYDLMDRWNNIQGGEWVAENILKDIDNFEDIMLHAMRNISHTEGFRISASDYTAFEQAMHDSLDSGETQSLDQAESDNIRESKMTDGWMVNHIHTSAISSLSPRVRKYIRSLNATTGEYDKNGKPIPMLNTRGQIQKVNEGLAIMEIYKAMQKANNANDIIPIMRDMSVKHPWALDIVRALEEDDIFFSQFYTNFNKHHNKFGVTKAISGNSGIITYNTIMANVSESVKPLLDEVRAVLSTKTVLNEFTSIYRGDKFDSGNIEDNADVIKEIQSKWPKIKRSKNQTAIIEFINQYYDDINELLQGFGFSVDSDVLNNLLFGVVKDLNNNKDVITSLLNTLNKINNWAAKNDTKIQAPLDIYNQNRGNYTAIAEIIKNSMDEYIESGVTENGKSYWSYLKPNFLSSLIKRMKDLDPHSEEGKAWLQKEFEQYDGILFNSQTGEYFIDWLNTLYKSEGFKTRDNLDVKTVITFNKKSYNELSDIEYQLMLLTEYFSAKDSAWYHVPILAEAPVAKFIRFEKHTGQNAPELIAQKMAKTVFMQEYARIKVVRERRITNTDDLGLIKHFDTRGEEFQFLKMLNPLIDEIDALAKKAEETKNYSALHSYITEAIISHYDSAVESNFARMHTQGLLEKLGDSNVLKFFQNLSFGVDGNTSINFTNIKEALREYYYNSAFATSNIIQLTSTDLAFFDGIDGFQKRNKQLHAPKDSLNTYAKYNGKRVGKEKETFIVLKDEYANSAKETYHNAIEALKNDKNLKSSEAKRIAEMYNDVKFSAAHNLTDAQGIRSLESARSIMIMFGDWTDQHEESYNRLNNGTWTRDDYSLILQTFKPYAYGQVTKDSGIVNPLTGETYKLKVPTQHKNSEMILIPSMAKHFNSPKLQGLLDAMNGGEYQEIVRNADGKEVSITKHAPKVDVIMFESAVKVGLQGALDLSDLNSASEISNYIKWHAGNVNVYQTMDYENYGKQQPVNEHLQDTSSIFGSQIRAIIMENVSDEMEFEIGGRTIKGNEFKKLYNDNITENLIADYQTVKDIFEDPQRLQELLQEEILNSSHYSDTLLHALSLRPDGKFRLPPFDESQSVRIQQLMNSVWRSRTTRQKINGGKVVNLTSYGVSNDLQMKWERDSQGRPHISYMEAYLPFWSENVGEDVLELMEKNDGIIPVQTLLDRGIIDEEMLNIIGYRIPTENKYSAWNIRIKGFLPRSAGGNIILPAEITTIAGLDFDIDSTYLMIKNIRTKIDNNSANNDFINQSSKWKKALEENEIRHKNLPESKELNSNKIKINAYEEMIKSDDYKKDFNRWLKEVTNKDPHIYRKGFETIKYDLNKDVSQMSRKQRDNLSIDMIRNTLKHPELIAHTLDPNNFDKLKAASRRMEMLATGKASSWSEVKNMSLDQLKDEVSGNDLDILDFGSQISLFKKNTVAATLIGMIATHRVNYAISQGKPMTVRWIERKKDGKLYRFPKYFINGTFNDNISNVMDPTKSFYISSALASATAASVDAVKDPVLDGMNYNLFTADVAMLLTRSGYSEDDIALFLRQPAIMKVINIHEREFDSYPTKSQSIEKAIQYYSKFLIQSDKEILPPSVKRNPLSRNDLAASIYEYGQSGKFDAQFQLDVIMTFKNMVQTAERLSKFIGATQAHTGSGGAGPEIVDNILNMNKVIKNLDDDAHIKGLQITEMLRRNDFNNPEVLRNKLREHPLGYVGAMTSIGWQATEYAFDKYFPYYKPHYGTIIDTLEEQMPSGRVNRQRMREIYSDWLSYYMSQFSSFESDRASYYINEFPKVFTEFRKNNPELENTMFFKHLYIATPSETEPFYRLRFSAGGKLHPMLRDQIIAEWEMMLYSDKYSEMAKELYLYNVHTKGFSFGPNTFIHLASTAIKEAIPGLIDNMYSMHDVEMSNGHIQDIRYVADEYKDSDNETSKQLAEIFENNSDDLEELSLNVNLSEAKSSILNDIISTGYIRHGDIMYSILTSTNLETNITNIEFKQVHKELVFSQSSISEFIDQYYRNHLYDKQLVPTWKKEEFPLPLNEMLNSDKPFDVQYYKIPSVMGTSMAPYVRIPGAKNSEVYKVIIHDFAIDSEGREYGLKISLTTAEPLGLKNVIKSYSFDNPVLSNPIQTVETVDDGEVDLPGNITNSNDPYEDSIPLGRAFEHTDDNFGFIEEWENASNNFTDYGSPEDSGTNFDYSDLEQGITSVPVEDISNIPVESISGSSMTFAQAKVALEAQKAPKQEPTSSTSSMTFAQAQELAKQKKAGDSKQFQNKEMVRPDLISSESAIREVASRMSSRIGIPVRFENKPYKNYSGYYDGKRAVINLAHATLDTPIHELMGHPILNEIKRTNPELYNNLLLELDSDWGQEILEALKFSEFNNNNIPYELKEEQRGPHTYYTVSYEVNGEKQLEYFEFKEEADLLILDLISKRTEEELKDEAIVQLLGEYTANRIKSTPKNIGFIGLLRNLLREMTDYIRKLFSSKEINVSKLTADMTLEDLSNILAYSDNKIVLDGYHVEYSTPDGRSFLSFEEADQHRKSLMDEIDRYEKIKPSLESFQDALWDTPKLNRIKEIENIMTDAGFSIHDFVSEYRQAINSVNDYDMHVHYDLRDKFSNDTSNKHDYEKLNDLFYEYLSLKTEIKNSPLKSFIVDNFEYNLSNQIIEEWKKEHNINYDPEEVYNYGKGFYSNIGAFARMDVELLLKNLLNHLEDIQRVGGEYVVSATIRSPKEYIEKLDAYSQVRFVIFPESKDIKWAAGQDVYSGSVWDSPRVFNTKNKPEISGVSYSKAPNLQNLEYIRDKLFLLSNVKNYYAELGISLTTNNFRLETSRKASHEIKKLVKIINNKLDHKYGEVKKPENYGKVNRNKINKIINEWSDNGCGYSDPMLTTISEKLKNNFNVRFEVFRHGEYFKTTDLEEAFQLFKSSQIVEIRPVIDDIFKGVNDRQAEINYQVSQLKNLNRKFPRNMITNKVVESPKKTDIGVIELKDIPFQMADIKKLPGDVSKILSLVDPNTLESEQKKC